MNCYLKSATFVVSLISGALVVSSAGAHPDPGGDDHQHTGLEDFADPSASLAEIDALNSNVISAGPNAKVTKNLDVVGRGERNVGDATTDVWTHDGYSYTGTFNEPCGGDPEAGIWIWDTSNRKKVKFVDIIPSPVGSRSNDVKVDGMNSGAILVHSNEPCAAGGPGGFEIYNVDDPANPVFLAHVQVDEIAEITPLFYAPGVLEDNGVHNLWLFTQGSYDYVAVQSEGLFDGFQIFDITNPSSPTLVSGWGAEELFDSGVGALTLADDPTGARTADSITWLLSGVGGSRNRLLHDFTINADGTRAYLAHWDAGLIMLDIADPANPIFLSVAIDPVNGSLDGEVNSHSVWPNADGTIVIEGEEDFSAFEGASPFIGSMQFLNTIPGVGTSTQSGNTLEASPIDNSGTLTATTLTVDIGPLAGNAFEVLEMSFNSSLLGAGSVSGNLVWIGRACNGDIFDNTISLGDIAIARRGDCFFSDKAANAADAGAAAIVIANNQEGSAWGGLRIWDYSDPANPLLASTFNTECSASVVPSANCAANGTYSVHNVVVETLDDKTFAYVSWYWDGMIILNVTDPYNPVEIARYLDTTGPNDGLANDFWGVYKEPGKPFIYGSDRNGGLYVFKEKGSGSGK